MPRTRSRFLLTGAGPRTRRGGRPPASVDADVAQTGRRPLILDAIGRAGGIRTAVALGLAICVFALAASGLSADSANEASTPARPAERTTLKTQVSTPAHDTAAGQGRARRKARSSAVRAEKPNRASGHRPKRTRTTPSQAGRFSDDPGAVSARTPAPVAPPAPAPPAEVPGPAEPTPEPLSGGEVLYREFGP